MTTQSITSMEELIRTINLFPNNWAYRGQPNADWQLVPSLERMFGDLWTRDSVDKIENYYLGVFKERFHLYDKHNIEPKGKLGWLAMMQHYGVPTRLLDFTSSPYVALYFAIESYDRSSKKDLSLYALDYTKMMEASLGVIRRHDSAFMETRQTLHANRDKVFGETVDPRAYDIAWVAEPELLNARIDRQIGTFLLSGNKSKKLEQVLAEPTYGNDCLRKIIIPGALYEHIFALLRKMNITGKTVYGDMEGLAKSIRLEMTIYSMP